MGAIKSVRKALQRLTRRVAARFDEREAISYLHIGKTAGNTFRHIATQINRASPSVKIRIHDHRVKLPDLPATERYLFAIRSPEARFRSGFYSRKRHGQPLYDNAWNEHEREAFAHFDHANCLAEALFEEGSLGYHAFCAIKSIGHCSMEQINWIEPNGYFLELRPPISIIRQEHFEEDLQVFLRRIGVTFPVDLPQTDALALRFDYSGTPPLSDTAKANLRRWYAQDFEFHARCAQWIEARRTLDDRR